MHLQSGRLWSQAARLQIPALPLTLGNTCPLGASVAPFVRWG